MKHDDSVPYDTAMTEMCRMHGEAEEASAELQRLRDGIRALAAEWDFSADQTEHDNGATGCDRRVADSMRALAKELRALLHND